MLSDSRAGTISRRTILRFATLGGAIALGGLLATCGSGGTTPTTGASRSAAPPTAPTAPTVGASAPSTPPTVLPTVATVGSTGGATPGTPPSSSPTTPPAAPSAPATVSGTPPGDAGQIVGAVIRFSSGATAVDVTIGQDNPAVRDFLSLLPLTLTLEEFAGKEKVAYLPRRLAHSGSPGFDPEDGDLIYYVPWGNLGFYYDASGIEYSDQTIQIGKYSATRAQLDQLASQPVTIEVVRR